MRRWIYLLLIVLLLLALVSCRDKNTNTKPETLPPAQNEEKLGYVGGNVASGGLMASGDDGYIYYRSEADHWLLYKARRDGTEKQKLSEDVASSINVFNGWVYYTNYREDFKIYRIRTDGTGRQKLLAAYCDDLYVTEKYIIASIRNDNNEREIVRMHHDGTAVHTILSDAALQYYYDGFVYFTDSNLMLWKYNMQDGKHTQLTDVYSTYVTADKDGVYYWRPDENTFNHIAPDGTDSVLIKNGDHFNYCSGAVYYMKLGYNNYNFFRYDITTGNEEQLTHFTGEIWNGRTGKIIENVSIYKPENLFDDPESSDDLYFDDSATKIYILYDKPYFRGTLRECLLKTDGQRVDCLFTFDLDNSVVVWD